MAGVESIVQNQELRKRILFTIFILGVYRIGVHVPIPGVNGTAVMAFFAAQKSGLFGLFNTFTGGKGRFSMTNVEIDPTGKTQVPNAETQMDLTPAGAPVAGFQFRQNIKNRILMVGFNWRGET